MSNEKRRRKLVDVDNVRSEYCCSFVPQVDHNNDISHDNTSSSNSRDTDVSFPMQGDEIKKFYQSVTSTPQNNNENYTSTNRETVRGKRRKKVSKSRHAASSSSSNIKPEVISSDDEVVVTKEISRDKTSTQKLITRFHILASQEGSREDLERFIGGMSDRSDFREILEGRDAHGWSGLMCAAAAGNLEVVKYLVEVVGCRWRGVWDKGGCDLFRICEENQQQEVMEYLQNRRNPVSEDPKPDVSESNDLSLDDPDSMISCEHCSIEYHRSQRKQHLTSMMHL